MRRLLLLLLAPGCAWISDAELAAAHDHDGDGLAAQAAGGDDCDDDDPAVGAATPSYADQDGDGFGAGDPLVSCSVPAGYATAAGDCDDVDPARHPGASETCDGADDDCDGVTDEPDATDATTWYGDADGDGEGDAAAAQVACTQPAGTADNARDCDDAVAEVSSAAAERCNGRDDDCDGATDEPDAADAPTWYADADGDGDGTPDEGTVACDAPLGAVDNARDCDDTSAEVSSAAEERCNAVDDDCDGATDEVDGAVWFADLDGDADGDPATFRIGAEAPEGFVAAAGDCDDGDAAIGAVPTPWAWWRFDEGAGGAATDEVSAAELDTTAAAWTTGVAGGALDAADGAALASTSFGPFSALTLAAWVRVGDTTGERGLLVSVTEVDEAGRWRLDGGHLAYGDAVGPTALGAGTWHHVATTYDAASGAVTHYLDGVVDAAAVVTEARVAEFLTPEVAGDLGGELDELMLFAEVLDAAQVARLAAAGARGDVACVTGLTTPELAEDTPRAWQPDLDGDGTGAGEAVWSCAAVSGAASGADDCDDADAEVHPGAAESCNDVDDDCDGVADEAGALGESDWYVDGDGDGIGAGASVEACAAPVGHAGLRSGSEDCDDTNAANYPGNAEVCDGVDNDCDTEADWLRNVPADYATLQDAHDSTAPGDTICVAAGSYDPVEITNPELTFEGYEGAAVTFIDGGGADRPVYVYHAESLTLRGFTLTGGCCGAGGGIRLEDAVDAWLEDLVISGNEGYAGAGVYANGSSTTLVGVDILDNLGTGSGVEGAGLWAGGGALTLQNVRIAGNRAEVTDKCSGAGAYLWNVDDGLSLTNVEVVGNVCAATDGAATDRAAGVLTIGTDTSLENVSIVGNESDAGSTRPDAIGWYSEGGHIDVVNTVNAWNTAVVSPTYGGWSGDTNATWAFRYCDTYGNDGGAYIGTNPTGTDGNVAVDPGFTDTSATDPADWDLTLASGSALIDAGDPAILDGDGSRSDVGAQGGPDGSR